MEIIFELLSEIFMEGCMDAARHPRISKWIRLLLLTVPFVFLETVFILVAVAGVNDCNTFLTVFCFSLAGVFLLLWIYLLIKLIKI